MRKYTTVHIPETLAKPIDQLLGDDIAAYSSRSEFVKDAIRRLLDFYGYLPKKQARETRK